MKTYYLFLRDDPQALAAISPAEMQAIVEKYVRWREENASRVSGGEKLKDGEGVVLRRRGSALERADGPFVEAREILGGYFVAQAESLADAEALARTCPHLDFGSIEIREMEPTD